MRLPLIGQLVWDRAYEAGKRDAQNESAVIWATHGRQQYDKGVEDALAGAVQRVEALFPMPDLPQPIRGEWVIAAIKGES